MVLSLERPAARAANHILFRDASWRLYQTILEEIGDGAMRVTYDKGRMEIMSPLPEHERAKRWLGRMVEALTEERGIPLGSLGSTTWSAEGLAKGLEADECYYIANEHLVRDKRRLDLAVDPPPDLAMAIDITYRAIDREAIYAALGVPEVWRYDGQKLECLVLEGDGYRISAHSRAMPFLAVGELVRFLDMVPEVGETAMLRAFRQWVRSLPQQ